MTPNFTMECCFVKYDARPETWNSRNNCQGDCTTRAITYALGGEMTYNEIEAEQYRLAREFCGLRNQTGIYDKILTRRGYIWLQLRTRVTRGTLGYIFRDINAKVLTLSRSHIAVVDGGYLADTWDSRRGRVFGILFHNSFRTEISSALFENGIDFTTTARPVYLKEFRNKRRTPRYFGW